MSYPNWPNLGKTNSTIFDDIFKKSHSFFDSKDINIYEDDLAYYFIIDVPGFNKDNLNIELNKKTNIVTISGKTKHRTLDKKFSLNFNCDIDSASVVDGVLRLTFKKTDGDSDIRKIEIE